MATFTERTVKYASDKKHINYLVAGPENGPLIILIHGWPAIGLTWKHQITLLASLGFRVVAPDMPGYGKSTANKLIEDYSLENIVEGLLALLADTGREQAIWVAHDWGSGCVAALAATHPEACKAVVWMALGYRAIELGLEQLVSVGINRNMYPEDEYPVGQWDYQLFYQESFEKATANFDRQNASFIKVAYSGSSPASMSKPTFTSSARKDGGWFGGKELPPADQIPFDNCLLDEETYRELVAAMEKTGYYCADAYYMNHERNRAFTLSQQKNGGVLNMPVLFIQANYDSVCDYVNTRALDPMKDYCNNLSLTAIDAGHWVALEKPVETNAAMVKWLATEVTDWWPGAWSNTLITHKKVRSQL